MADILILDDDEQIVKLTRTFVEREGYRVIVAHDGNEALQTIEREQPRLLVTDILMPGIDGIEIINTCRKTHPNLKILAMSGGRRKISADFNLKSATMLGANDVLPKPFSKEQLLTKINKLLRD